MPFVPPPPQPVFTPPPPRPVKPPKAKPPTKVKTSKPPATHPPAAPKAPRAPVHKTSRPRVPRRTPADPKHHNAPIDPPKHKSGKATKASGYLTGGGAGAAAYKGTISHKAGAAPRTPRAPTPHVPKAHVAKAPLQLSDASFVGRDSHVQVSHALTHLQPFTTRQHTASGRHH